ncbi:hypothetical protein BKA70DRAFT_1277065 [Coprinopsis sp. MPI-PUGE-AT-0042]|nr:hypothetical protein BKA70DRAFT_1277065 [Coprinopsis sp. MPI-PUGE-AT-0042]
MVAVDSRVSPNTLSLLRLPSSPRWTTATQTGRTVASEPIRPRIRQSAYLPGTSNLILATDCLDSRPFVSRGLLITLAGSHNQLSQRGANQGIHVNPLHHSPTSQYHPAINEQSTTPPSGRLVRPGRLRLLGHSMLAIGFLARLPESDLKLTLQHFPNRTRTYRCNVEQCLSVRPLQPDLRSAVPRRSTSSTVDRVGNVSWRTGIRLN